MVQAGPFHAPPSPSCSIYEALHLRLHQSTGQPRAFACETFYKKVKLRQAHSQMQPHTMQVRCCTAQMICMRRLPALCNTCEALRKTGGMVPSTGAASCRTLGAPSMVHLRSISGAAWHRQAASSLVTASCSMCEMLHGTTGIQLGVSGHSVRCVSQRGCVR